MFCGPTLIRAYLQNILMALSNEQQDQAAFHTRHALDLLECPVPPQLAYGIALDEGVVRRKQQNQDMAFATSFFVGSFPVGLFVIADGMGGHANGADASRLAVHSFIDTLLACLISGLVTSVPQALTEAVQTANRAVYKQNCEVLGRDKMGTTLTAVVALGNVWYAANVGDSRVYLLREGQLRQITRDHSVVAALIEAGQISPQEAYTHPRRNAIYRSLGEVQAVEVDVFPLSIVNGDVVLLCSDGLWEMVPDVQQIERILQKRDLDVASRAEHLAGLANDAGGDDNIGIIVIEIPKIDDLPTLCIGSTTS